jgi:hypothetical protein
MMWGIRPGPLLFQNNADLVWGLISSKFIGNFLLLLMNIFLIPLFVSILRVPYQYPIVPLVLALVLGRCLAAIPSPTPTKPWIISVPSDMQHVRKKGLCFMQKFVFPLTSLRRQALFSPAMIWRLKEDTWSNLQHRKWDFLFLKTGPKR